MKWNKIIGFSMMNSKIVLILLKYNPQNTLNEKTLTIQSIINDKKRKKKSGKE